MTKKVIATPIHYHLREDTSFWPYSDNGDYTVKIGYKIAQLDFGEGGSADNSSSRPEDNIWRHVWKANVMPKVNVDAAYDANLMKGAIAAVVRDEAGEFLTGAARTFICNSPIAAEAIAVREAISLAGVFDSFDVIIESNCANVVKGCGDSVPQWKIQAFVVDIKRMLAENQRVKIKWVRRSANKVADQVAKSMIRGNLPRFWTWMMPVRIRTLLLEDKIVCRSFSP